MGLSEREQQLLDEMERRLYQSEADVVQTPAGPRPQLNLRFLVFGVLLVLAGIGVLIVGVAAQMLWFGIIGFAFMLGGVLLATTQRENAPAVNSGTRAASGSGKERVDSQRESFSDRMNRRWDERMDGDR